MPQKRTFLPLLLCLLTACAVGPQETQRSPALPGTETPDSTPPSPTQTPGLAGHDPVRELIVWLPPDIAPDPTTPAGEILLAHLNQFELDHLGLTITLRVKTIRGAGSMLEALEATVAAAPSIAPDLLALDPSNLMTAALKGMIQPLEGHLAPPIQPQWYSFASAASRVDGVFYGVPLVSDADVFAYRVSAFASPPLRWQDILSSSETILLPLADPVASFTLAQYLALDGQIMDGAGKAVLDAAILQEILEFYSIAVTENRVSTSSFQFASQAETWTALLENRTRAAPASLNAFLTNYNPTRFTAVTLPTREGDGMSFTTSWSLALVTNDPARTTLVEDLLEWMLDPAFLGAWSFALGYLPSTAEALSNWPEGPATALASELVASGVPYPDQEILLTLSPLLQTAVEDVLRKGITPGQAARNAVDELGTP